MSNNLNVKLQKPIVLLKVHSTGKNTDKDRIVQLSVTKYAPKSEPISNTRYINPEMEIPADVTDYHGISNEDVQGAKTFSQIAPKLAKFIGESDIAGFGINFDVSILVEEFNRAGVSFSVKDRKIINLSEIYNKLKPRDIYAAIEEFTGNKVKSTRTFSADEYNRASVAIFNGMINQYAGKQFVDRSGQSHDVEATIESFYDVFSGSKSKLDFKGYIILNKDNRPILNFGKHRGEILSEFFATDEGKGYYNWCITKGNYPQDTKEVMTRYYNQVIDEQNTTVLSQDEINQ